jgi:ATP-binding cassette subfamily F protein 3
MITIKNLAIGFSGEHLFESANFVINPEDKIGLMGRNGSGKSTFLRCLLHEVEPDEGAVHIPSGYRIGHLAQHIAFAHSLVIDEVCSVLSEERQYEGWKGESILMGLGFTLEDMLEDPNDFSGGEQVKIQLAKLLLAEPNMLLLDEPTNYLDIHSVRWLKSFLGKWDGEIILITHDRDFMDSIISHTLNIHRGQMKKIPGATEDAYAHIVTEEEHYEKTRQNVAKEREKTEAWIKRFKAKASMAKRVQSRVKLLEKQAQQEKLSEIASLDFVFNEAPVIQKGMLAVVDNLCFSYDNNPLIPPVSLEIGPHDRICVIGKNGKGKSTLLKLLVGELTPISGSVSMHDRVALGYFGQMNIERLRPSDTVYESMQEAAPTSSQTAVRQVCAHMLFPGGLANKPVSVLSGGEKSRVMLGKILLQPTNLLLLDEPTNHLDLDACESLLDAIQCFSGAIIMVTHSEYFLHQVATKLIVFDADTISVFDGSYADFLQQVGWSDEKG